MAAKIRVKWPDGPICGICFTTALRTRGSCPGCAEDRLLPGKAGGESICRDCAGISTNMTCDSCGAEAERFRAGHCIRCVLRTDLEMLLKPHSPPDLRLKALINVFAAVERPESIYTWMRGENPQELLARLGTRNLALTHESFDALPGNRSVEHLRELLIRHGMLPARDRQLATFERWLATRIDDLANTPTIQSPIERFATWHHLKRFRSLTSQGRDLSAAVRSAKQEITESGKFLAWLGTEYGLTISEVRQGHLDEYLSEGPSTRHSIGTFILWLVKNHETATLEVPHRYPATRPLITQQQRIELIRHCLESGHLPVAPRVAALILLLFAQRIGKIAALRCSDLQTQPDGLHLNLGNIPVLVPAQVAPMFWDYLTHRPNQQTSNGASPWLFPGTMPGQHIHADSMLVQIRNLGIDPGGARNSTLRSLVQELQPTLVANALGYSYQVIHKHAADAAVPLAGYARKVPKTP